jgi:4'-phosphopantetheinyl transferase
MMQFQRIPTSVSWLEIEADRLSGFAEADLVAILSPVERERLEGMRFPKRREEWLQGRYAAKKLLRSALTNQLAGIGDANLTIGNRDSGEPFVIVEGWGELAGSISISHRGGYAAAAWCPDPGCRVGIDLELVEGRHPAFLEDYYSFNEIEFARHLVPQEQDLWITMAWSAKESILKALGLGLRLDLRRIEVFPISFPVSDGKWQPLCFTTDITPAGALHIWGATHGAEVRTLSFLELSSSALQTPAGDPCGRASVGSAPA